MVPDTHEQIKSIMIEVVQNGGNIATIVQAIEKVKKPENLIEYMKLFRRAFDLTINEARELVFWHHFVTNGISDDEIDHILIPLIRKNLV